MRTLMFLTAMAFFVDCASCFAQQPAVPATADALQQKVVAASKAKATNKEGWISLLPEKGLEGWEVTDFGGQGAVSRKGELLLLEKGEPLTGVNYTKQDFPKSNFEIELEAQRIDGSDFLCGLTFPVGDEFCSFIAGGWGGGVVGLSSVDGYDASENSTSTYHNFENGKWYKFRVAVDDKEIVAYIDDKEVVLQEREGNKFSLRIEVYASRPLGFCAFMSQVAVRNFRWREISSQESDDGK